MPTHQKIESHDSNSLKSRLKIFGLHTIFTMQYVLSTFNTNASAYVILYVVESYYSISSWLS